MDPRLFVIQLNYIASLEKVDQYIIPHREHLDYYYQSGHFLASGPQVPRTGGIILAQARNKIELDKIMQNDPFIIEAIAEYQIIEFEVVKSSSVLKNFWLGQSSEEKTL